MFKAAPRRIGAGRLLYIRIKKKLSANNYYYNGNVRRYIVSKLVIVEDTDWTYLENTEENTLTLITCVENEPSYRRCVQATEDVSK